MGRWWSAAGLGALSVAVPAWDLLKEVAIIFITSTIVWSLMSWGFPDSLIGKESICNAGDPSLIPGLGRSAGEGLGLPTPVFLGFTRGSASKESACNGGDLGSVPGLGRSPGEGKGYPL